MPPRQAARFIFVHTDHLGSPRKLTDAAKTVVWSLRHGPFGEGVSVTGTLAQSLRFPGQYADGESALSYNWRRTYDPSLGRYLQSDPIGLAGGINSYAYVNGNPLIYTDPTGECPWRLPVLAGAASGAGLDLLLQLLQNGGDLNCIDWESLGLSAALGAGGGGLSAKLLKLLSKAGVKIVASNGTEITGFTRHGINRAIGDGASRAGVKPEAVLDALKNPSKIVEGVDSLGRPFQVFHGTGARVVVNPQTGDIVSTNPLSGAGAASRAP